MKVFARKFRGFDKIELDLEKTYFLVGDNSSGKSSLAYLVDAICQSDLNFSPKIGEHFGDSRYDYFSPFFDYEDVEFALLNEDKNGDEYAKFITVRRKKGDQPYVIRCTHWCAGFYVTLKIHEEGVVYRTGSSKRPFSFDMLAKIHGSDPKNWKSCNVKRANISEGVSLFGFLEISDDAQRNLILKGYGLDTSPCRFVSPLRALPERFYSSVRKIDALGGHFAKVWLDLSGVGDRVIADIDSFGKEAKLFDHLSVQEVETTVDDPPLMVTVEKHGKKFTLDQVGIGVSQVVPLLIDTVFSLEVDKRVILSQQPELHLHPIAQAALGSYLYRAKKSGLRAIYETHSSFLLDRFRADYRDDLEKEGSQKCEDVVILFCRNTTSGNEVVEISIRNDGSFVNDPEDFHEFFLTEIARTIF
jgi:hypothetical protein